MPTFLPAEFEMDMSNVKKGLNYEMEMTSSAAVFFYRQPLCSILLARQLILPFFAVVMSTTDLARAWEGDSVVRERARQLQAVS